MGNSQNRAAEDIPAPGTYYLSPSQIEAWLTCQRKWAWHYLGGLQEPEKKSAAIGTAMHDDQLAPYLSERRPLDFDQVVHGVRPAEVAAQGLQFLPAPMSPGLEVERYFKFETALPGVFVRGFKDYVETIPTRKVGDHKSCGNWAYAKTADTLLTDVQAVIYAKDELLRAPAPAIDMQWTYYGTKKPYKAKPVYVTMTTEHVDAMMVHVTDIAHEIVTTLKAKPHPLALPFNSGACEKYGGCAFKGNCNLSPSERRFKGMSNTPQNTGSLLERLNAAKNAANGAAPAQMTLAEKMAAAKAAKEAPAPTPAAAPAPVIQDTPSGTTTFSATFQAAPETPSTVTNTMPASDQPINCPTDFQPPPPPGAPEEETKTAAPKGRPKGAKNKPKDALDTPAPNGTPAPVQDGAIGTLFLNCTPDSGDYTRADDLIATAKSEIETSKNVADYRFIEYAHGAGMLSVRVAELASGLQEVFLDATTPEGAVCKSALVAKACRVIRGL